MIRIKYGQLKRIIREEFARADRLNEEASYHRKGYTDTRGRDYPPETVHYSPEQRSQSAKSHLLRYDYEPKSEASMIEDDDLDMMGELDAVDDMDELDENELDEKEYKAIPGMKKYAHKGKFDLSACYDDLKGKKGIDNPRALCRSAEIATTHKAQGTR